MSASRLLQPSLSHDAVGDVVRRAWSAHQRSEYALALGLRRLLRDNVHRGRGHASFSDFAEREFGIPPKLAWVFAAMGRSLERLPATRAAFESGDLSLTLIREYLRIATERDEADWVDFARTHTRREIEERAARAEDESAGREHVVRRRVASRLTAAEVQAARKVRETLLRKTGKPVPEEKLLGALATAVAEGSLSEAAPAARPRPYVTVGLCPSCGDTWVPVSGFDMEVTLEDWVSRLRETGEFVSMLAGQLCDCRDVKHRRDRCPHPSPRRDAPVRTRHIPADVRRLIEARDGHRCRVPGCTCDGPLEFSHLERYADGGPTIPETVAQHCWAHNRMIETGRVIVKGRAPFESYFLPDGTPIGVGCDPRPALPGPAPHSQSGTGT